MITNLAFWLSLIVKMAVTASFVVAASFAAQRAGALIGALFATLPISAGPVYVFLALDHDAAFIAASALASMVINAGTAVFCLTYATLAQNRGMLFGLTAALAVWFIIGSIVRCFDWNLAVATLFCLLIYPPALYLSRPYRHAPMPRSPRRWYDMPLRAGLVAMLVCIVVVTSPYLGPFGSGMLAVFPVVLTSIILILHPRVGARATAAVIANTISGLVGFAIGLGVLHLAAVPLGVWSAFALTLAICMGWNILVFTARQRGIPL